MRHQTIDQGSVGRDSPILIKLGDGVVDLGVKYVSAYHLIIKPSIQR